MNYSEADPSPSARARDQTTADFQSCQLATTSADSKTSADLRLLLIPRSLLIVRLLIARAIPRLPLEIIFL